jgi:hypothetical protein
MEEKLIIVLYVGVYGIRSEDIHDFVQKVAAKISPSTFEGELIVIPTQSPDTRLECINPKYITDEELIKQHTEMMKKLQEELQYQAGLLKENKNEQ